MDLWDYIIVGAGSAGCVLADRLGAHPRWRILVIEAGGSDRNLWIKMPLGYGKLYTDARFNWCYTAAADAGLNGRSGYWPRGKVLGGSGSINAMAYVRGLPKDHDDWASDGAKGWSWRDVAPAYDAIEASGLRITDLADRIHPFSKHFLSASQEMGWRDGAGLAPMRATLWKGQRWSPADAFLRPALKRGNVKVITGGHVEELEMTGRRITGVRYRHGDQSYTASAKAEVILSAGAIGSPQILMLSGIGNPAVLRGLGISPRHDLPHVGQGLQDHLALTLGFTATEPTLNGTLGRTVPRWLAGIRYILGRKGPLSLPVNQIAGFVASDNTQPLPDLQLYANPMSYDATREKRPTVSSYPGFLLSAQPCRPTSRGAVTLRSPDPLDAPVIQPNSLSTDTDCDQAIRAGRMLRRLAQTPALRAVTRTPDWPSLSVMSDQELLELFRSEAASNYHACATCRMGRSALDSVIDSRLRVHGLSGLRVVDAASFPSVTSGNTQAPVMMLAHRAAESIMADAAKGGLT
jgi:choline dehydrogenase